MRRATVTALVAITLYAACAHGQGNQREPHIGYVYPAGGQQGTTFQVTVGGQFLRGASQAFVSGEGVHVRVLEQFPPLRNIEKEQREALAERFRSLFKERWSELVKDGDVDAAPPWRRLAELGLRNKPMNEDDTAEGAKELPKHPLLYDLDKKNIRELLDIVHHFRTRKKGQLNTQLAEAVVLEVNVERDALPGDRELRLLTRAGLTNPLVFQVGTLPEARDLEPDEGLALDFLPAEQPLEPPFVINGQIMPGDVDLFRIRAKKGQRLVIETYARHLIPYLADAVPGWFQATLTLRNENGDELAFVDDYRFSPDPVLLYEVPKDGVLELEVRDSIYRGREDFVYRISVSERRFITSVFPLGCRTGQNCLVKVDGWNLTSDRWYLDGESDDTPGVRQKPMRGKSASNPVTYEVNPLSACKETESNNTITESQRMRPPHVIDGRIGQPGDVDVFAFAGKAGNEIVAEVIARRVRSPLDSLLRLLDADGNILAWNDDYERTEGFLHTDAGVLTHNADSYIRAQLPADGEYYIQVSDAQAQGGDAYAYRLRISPPQPDFELRVAPSSINLRGGLATPIRVYALRKDGFSGEIRIALDNAPKGFSLSGATIPAGRDHVRATLSAPGDMKAPLAVTPKGSALIGGRTVTHLAVPAEDMMQAFLYRHLTPTQELMVHVMDGRRFSRPPERADNKPVSIPAGGTARVVFKTRMQSAATRFEFDLNDPPQGVALKSVNPVAGGFEIELAAEAGTEPLGFIDNLIVEVFIKREPKEDKGPAGAQPSRISLGVLPAIPFEIVSK